MSKPKRNPSNTVESLVGAMQAALAGDIQPPDFVRLREGDGPFWAAVVRARARSEWTGADLVNAANLARAMADIERIQGEIDAEGDTLENARGTAVLNPKHALLETLSRRVMALNRLLQMNGRVTGTVEDKIKARKRENEARTVAESLKDDLIPLA